jgi:CheY-like chemotaxis protein
VAVILSADDDPDIRYLIKRILQDAGHRVLQAPDGRTALDIAFQGEIDLVILDVDMPGMCGLDVCRRLRDDARTSHLPVIIASGSLVPPYEEVHEAGATASLSKPFTAADLRATVSAQLAAEIAPPLAG